MRCTFCGLIKRPCRSRCGDAGMPRSRRDPEGFLGLRRLSVSDWHGWWAEPSRRKPDKSRHELLRVRSSKPGPRADLGRGDVVVGPVYPCVRHVVAVMSVGRAKHLSRTKLFRACKTGRVLPNMCGARFDAQPVRAARKACPRFVAAGLEVPRTTACTA